MKKFLAIGLALVIAYFAVSVFWWVIRNIFSLVFDLASIILVAIIALPLYFILRKKLQ